MNRLACQYAIVRFLPYAETGEFANVGIVLACPAVGYFDAKLMPTKNTGRITGFFEQLDKRIYREAMNYLREELDRVRALVGEQAAMAVQQAFASLTRPREALLRFGETRAILAENPETALDRLFSRFIERDFAGKEYHDQILERGIRETLRKANLRGYFQPGEIGNDDLHIHVPFVYRHEGHARFAIKPLDLAKGEPNNVFETGGRWVDRVRRLKRHELLPDEMMFAVGLPDGNLAIRRAADEIVGDLREQGIEVAEAADAKAIAAFASRAQH